MVAKAAPLSGTRSVGPTGDYANITAAIADVRAQTLDGALVLELQPAYVSGTETFPIAFTNLPTTAANTLTLRPAVGAVALFISSAAAGTVDLNNVQFVTIDGRPGGVGSHAGSGVGSASQLTITNTSTAGVALRIFNDASNNTIRYTTFRGVNTSGGNGVVLFSNTAGPNGSDNNTIDHCDIRDGASTPAVGIYAWGTTTTPAQYNSGNTISNCNIFNFYSATASAAGVRLDGGTTGWTITGNSFYQTASRAAAATNVYPILIFNNSGDNSDAGNNFNVTGNFIGGSAPNAGGTPWTTTGTTAAYSFQGIRLRVGTATPSNVQGNTIANMIWTSSSTATALPGVWSGIWVQDGSVNVGTMTGNTIGSGTGTGSVSVTTSGNWGTTFGIGIGSTSIGGVAVANNTIGSITVNGTSAAVSASLTGIHQATQGFSISNNTVGSTTTANSLNAATSSTSSTGQQVTGIFAASSASITGNTVANLNNNYAGTATTGQIRGISNGTTITGNTVRNLSTTSLSAGTNSAQSVCGIQDTAGFSGKTVSQNTVHSLANTTGTAAVSVTGIYVGSSSGLIPAGTVVARNLVHSLAISSTNASSVMNGMQFIAESCTARNNMVRVGLDVSGASTAGASIVRGIYDNGSTGDRKFYHNSIYVGGTQTSGTASTAAFVHLDPNGTRAFQNNLFINARSKGAAATGKHYAVQYGGTTVSPTGLKAGGNLFLASGTGGVLGLYNAIDRTTLIAWQAATGQDATSAVADPLFLAPAGTAATVDLHLQASNPAEGAGIPLAAVTDDFDGQTRSTLTPVDADADAGDFASTGDFFAPGISYPLLTSGSTTSRVLTGWATIIDNSGTVSAGANAPRLYYKKSTDADVFGVPNDSTGNGWKYVTATGSGPYSFTMDYALINGGSVTVGESIQYFVVAQDVANNLGSSPAAATAPTTPRVQTVNAHGAVNSFSIIPAISGTKTVGVAGDYPRLTGAGGLFAALNGAVISGNVLVKITSDMTEVSATGLNEITTNEFPASAYAITIQPDAATMRTISSTAGIALNGADRVTIDGRFGGGGRYLTFRSTSGGSTILFINDASDNTVRNCVVEGAWSSGVGSGAVIFFSTSRVTGNNNNLINACQVRDSSTDYGVPDVLIGSNGNNLGNTLANNELFNFDFSGIYIQQGADETWTVSGNDIYEAKPSVTGYQGISISSGGNNVISDNFIHDLFTTSSSSTGIGVSGPGITTVVRNRITAFNVNAATTNVRGIVVSGSVGSTVNVMNNQITLSPDASASRSLFGIYDFGIGGTVVNLSVVNLFYNSVVLGGSESGTSDSWASFRFNPSRHTARNNTFLNLRTGGTGSHFAAGSDYSGLYSVSHNVYGGTGAPGVIQVGAG